MDGLKFPVSHTPKHTKEINACAETKAKILLWTYVITGMSWDAPPQGAQVISYNGDKGTMGKTFEIVKIYPIFIAVCQAEEHFLPCRPLWPQLQQKAVGAQAYESSASSSS